MPWPLLLQAAVLIDSQIMCQAMHLSKLYASNCFTSWKSVMVPFLIDRVFTRMLPLAKTGIRITLYYLEGVLPILYYLGVGYSLYYITWGWGAPYTILPGGGALPTLYYLGVGYSLTLYFLGVGYSLHYITWGGVVSTLLPGHGDSEGRG